MLFLSNLLALVLAGVLMFAVLGYTTDAVEARPRQRRRPHVILGVLIFVVSVPLAAHTLVTYHIVTYSARVQHVAEDWVADTEGAEVTGVDLKATGAHVAVTHRAPLPSTDDLLRKLEGAVPDGLPVILDSTRGEETRIGSVGER